MIILKFVIDNSISLWTYQSGLAIIEAELSGYGPVCMFLDCCHVWELHWAVEEIKFQLKARSFLRGTFH